MGSALPLLATQLNKMLRSFAGQLCDTRSQALPIGRVAFEKGTTFGFAQGVAVVAPCVRPPEVELLLQLVRLGLQIPTLALLVDEWSMNGR